MSAGYTVSQVHLNTVFCLCLKPRVRVEPSLLSWYWIQLIYACAVKCISRPRFFFFSVDLLFYENLTETLVWLQSQISSDITFPSKINSSEFHCNGGMDWPFSFPEPTILLACGRNRELWEQTFWNNKGNNWILPIRFNSVFIYSACPKWLLPELSIPAAGQKDRRLWGRECGLTDKLWPAWLSGWLYWPTDGSSDPLTDRWTNGRTHRLTDSLDEGRTDWWTNGWKKERRGKYRIKYINTTHTTMPSIS